MSLCGCIKTCMKNTFYYFCESSKKVQNTNFCHNDNQLTTYILYTWKNINTHIQNVITYRKNNYIWLRNTLCSYSEHINMTYIVVTNIQKIYIYKWHYTPLLRVDLCKKYAISFSCSINTYLWKIYFLPTLYGLVLKIVHTIEIWSTSKCQDYVTTVTSIGPLP